MNKLVVMSAAIAAFSVVPAQAQEQCFDKGSLSYVDCPTVEALPPAAPVPFVEEELDWTGVYAGAHIGGGHASMEALVNNAGNPNRVLDDEYDASGLLGGGQVGYQYQFENNLVLGIEASISATDIDGDAAITRNNGTVRFLSEGDLDFLGSVMAKVGYAHGRVMPYAMAGVSFVSYDTTVARFNRAGAQVEAATIDENDIALALGGGVDVFLHDNIVVSGQGAYHFFDNELDIANALNRTDPGDEHKLDGMATFRVKLSYLF